MNKRIKKFNNSAGAILCSGCRTIIKEGWYASAHAQAYCKQEGLDPEVYLIKDEDWSSDEPLYCDKCKKDK